MMPVSRHPACNAGKRTASLLPAITPSRRRGGAAPQPRAALAYLGRMGENTFGYRMGAPGRKPRRDGPVTNSPGSGGGLPEAQGGAKAAQAVVNAGRTAATGTLAGSKAAQNGPDDGQRDQAGQRDEAVGGGTGVQDAEPGWLAARPAESADTYWRRRFTVLMIGLSLFAVAAWGLSQALRVSPGAPPAGSRHGGSGHGGAGTGQQAGRGGRPPGGSHGHGGPGGQAGAVTGASTSPRPAGNRAGRTAGGPRSGPSPAVTTRGGVFRGFHPAFCARHSIVLSLSSTQVGFGAGQVPTFSVSIVSTQPHACSFNVGSGHLALVIKEGPTRIWSSADCAAGATSLVTALNRGVPTVVAVSWDKKTSAPGCISPQRHVPAGVYTAYAADGTLISAPVTFRLG